MLSSQEIYDMLERRRTEIGLSQADASMMILGRKDSSFFQALRRGSVPSAARLEAACKALGLEFYFGPPRDDAHSVSTPPDRSEKSAAAEPQASEAESQNKRLEEIRAGLVGLRADIREGIAAIQANLEPPAEATAPVLVTLQEHKVPPFAWSARTAAGSGDPVFGELTEPRYAFHKSIIPDWVHPESLLCIEVTGDSMQPTIHDGDILLLDRSQTEPLSGQLFILHTPDGLIVKRLRRTGRRWMLISDNPAYEPRPVGREDRIVGRVAWAGAPPAEE